MQKLTNILIMLLTAALSLSGMDFGLRFNSHDFPTDKRTSVSFGNHQFRFANEFKIGFFLNFYASPMFGNILTMTTDDGQRVSLGASMIDDGSFRISLVVNDRLYYLDQPIAIDLATEDHITVWLDKPANLVRVQLNNAETEYPVDLANTHSITPLFGLENKIERADVAPIELRNARIFIDGKNTNHWDFKYHDTPSTSPDNLGDVTAQVKNPHWLIDEHADWTEIYRLDSKNSIQTAFNPDAEVFYVVDNSRILTFDPISKRTSEREITGGHRSMTYSNHLTCNPAANTLVNYNFNRKKSSILDLATGRWSNQQVSPDEASYSNHAVAIAGDTLYAYGGYGFYKYHNDLFTVNLADGEIVEHKLYPPLMPMTSAAAAVVGDKLYIFGGKGNDTGQQELPSSYQYALYEYDIHSWVGHLVWRLDHVERDFLPTQTMYYDPKEDCFYFGATSGGGELMSISRTAPELKTLSTGIMSKMEFHDFVFDLYRSNDGKRFYLVIDKRLDPQTHELGIYSISTPFITDPEVIANKMPAQAAEIKESTIAGRIMLCCIVGALLLIAGALWLYLHRKNAKPSAGATAGIAPMGYVPPIEPGDGLSTAVEADDAEQAAPAPEAEDFSFITLAGQSNDPQFFDTGKSSISFLGGFCVRDKDGNDITVKFTARLKHLLIMLLLSSLRYESGIKYQIIDEEIWGDKDEKSAQNNRNVSMRKLRMLLDEVGNVVISYDKGYFRIETNDVMFDYKELKSRIAEIRGVESVKPELVNQILELLLLGPMLPNTTYDWLDEYKSEFSNSALELLTKLLKYELKRDDNLAYRIAETISLHDMLNEEALVAKCQVLSRRKMLGIAKNIHSKFCKEYLKSMGEEYPLTFADACKKPL